MSASIHDQIAEEWPKVFTLLPEVHQAWRRMTVGEIVHVAVVMGSDGASRRAWDAGPGVIARGLRMMLDDPDSVVFRGSL